MIQFHIDRQTALDLQFIEAMSSMASHPLTLEEAKEMNRQIKRLENNSVRKSGMFD